MGRRHNRRSSQDLKAMLLSPAGGKFLRPEDPFDEVLPGVLLGDASTALSTLLLKDMKVTHILNAAMGKNDDFYGGGGYVNTSPNYYDRLSIKFMGIPALDTPSFYLRPWFQKAADFISDALRAKGGKVLVHCQAGISRSAALIAAYLMIKKGMNVEEALGAIRTKRSIFPNQGFLSQLCDFDYELQRSGVITQNPTGALDMTKPIKDSLRSTYRGAHQRQFSDTNYYPFRPPHTRYGNPLSSTSMYDSPARARSEERYDDSRVRCRSPSPYRGGRSVSVLPDTTYYWDRPTKDGEGDTCLPHEKPIGSSLLSSHDLSRPFQTSYSYSRSTPAPAYTPRFIPKETPRVMASRYTSRPSLYEKTYSAPDLAASYGSRSRPSSSPAYTPSYSTYTRSSYSPTTFSASSYLAPVVRRSYETYAPALGTSNYYSYRRSPISVASTYVLPDCRPYQSTTLRYPSIWTRVYSY